jgi:DNA-binding transcriptional regulator LsrR (DeoR family)
MTGTDKIMLSQEELKKSHVIRKVIEKEVTQVEAAEMLKLSDRQVRRLLKRFRVEGRWPGRFVFRSG